MEMPLVSGEMTYRHGAVENVSDVLEGKVLDQSLPKQPKRNGELVTLIVLLMIFRK